MRGELKELSNLYLHFSNQKGYEFLCEALKEGKTIYIKKRDIIFKVYITKVDLSPLTSRIEIEFLVTKADSAKGRPLDEGKVKIYEDIAKPHFVFNQIY